MTIKYLALGGIILDDVIFPDGRSAMSQLGGGGMYAAAGMRLWTDQVGLLARVGPDFDFGLLTDLHLDESAIQVNQRPTPRAWQLYEVDGTRTQIPRIPPADWQAQLSLTPSGLPEIPGLRGVHLAGRGNPAERELAAHLAQSGLIISFEPIVEDGIEARHRQVIFETLHFVDIFSPGLKEMRVLLGEPARSDALKQFGQMGPRLITLRCGAEGSLVYEPETGRTWQVPAAPTQVVDVTGAGNAYAGGFLAGWGETDQVELASAQAAVSAAITLEQIGPPQITPARLAEAQQRRDDCLTQIQELAA
jgi:sugar/nucleoside kinase (ribokinase family)